MLCEISHADVVDRAARQIQAVAKYYEHVKRDLLSNLACSWDDRLFVRRPTEEDEFLDLEPYVSCAVGNVLKNRNRLVGGMPDIDVSGEYFVFCPILSMNDGMAQDNSGGFFDVHNCPGWIAWVDWWKRPDNSVLICWVPNWLVDRVDKGIDYNAEGCLEWIKRTKPL